MLPKSLRKIHHWCRPGGILDLDFSGKLKCIPFPSLQRMENVDNHSWEYWLTTFHSSSHLFSSDLSPKLCFEDGVAADMQAAFEIFRSFEPAQPSICHICHYLSYLSHLPLGTIYHLWLFVCLLLGPWVDATYFHQNIWYANKVMFQTISTASTHWSLKYVPWN